MDKQRLLPTLDTIASCPVSVLHGLFEEFLHYSPPKRASAVFLRGNLAWVVQAINDGNEPSDLRKEMLKVATASISGNRIQHQPGTRLVREWQGEIYEVTILEKGYRWQDRHYQSLSRIAGEITGAHWSGPRFFRMMKKQ